MKQKLRFGLVLGLAGSIEILLKYATFEGSFFMFSQAKKMANESFCIL